MKQLFTEINEAIDARDLQGDDSKLIALLEQYPSLIDGKLIQQATSTERESN